MQTQGDCCRVSATSRGSCRCRMLCLTRQPSMGAEVWQPSALLRTGTRGLHSGRMCNCKNCQHVAQVRGSGGRRRVGELVLRSCMSREGSSAASREPLTGWHQLPLRRRVGVARHIPSAEVRGGVRFGRGGRVRARAAQLCARRRGGYGPAGGERRPGRRVPGRARAAGGRHARAPRRGAAAAAAAGVHCDHGADQGAPGLVCHAGPLLRAGARACLSPFVRCLACEHHVWLQKNRARSRARNEGMRSRFSKHTRAGDGPRVGGVPARLRQPLCVCRVQEHGALAAGVPTDQASTETSASHFAMAEQAALTLAGCKDQVDPVPRDTKLGLGILAHVQMHIVRNECWTSSRRRRWLQPRADNRTCMRSNTAFMCRSMRRWTCLRRCGRRALWTFARPQPRPATSRLWPPSPAEAVRRGAAVCAAPTAMGWTSCLLRYGATASHLMRSLPDLSSLTA